jgi:Na+-driven multidrug efflux pump
VKDLTTGKEGKLIWQFAIPMLLGNIFHQLYNVVDSWVVGNYLGKEALSAVGASHPLIFLLISLVIGVSMGSTIIISQYFGAKDYNKVKISIDTLYIIMFFSGI